MSDLRQYRRPQRQGRSLDQIAGLEWPPDPRITVRSHCSELGSWQSVLREPPAHLREYIHGPYLGWVETIPGTFRRREVASAIVPLIINWGSPYGIVEPTKPCAAPRPIGTFVAGLHNSFAITESYGLHECAQVNFTPLGAYLFLRLPMHSLTDCVVELEVLLGAVVTRLEAQLYEATSWSDRFHLIDAFVTERILASRAPSREVNWAWRALNGSCGPTSIGRLARELGWSPKHLITKFREQIGLPPKTVARIIRFGSALRRLEAAPESRWAEIALDCGYYDQPHLIRDFRAFAGSTPSEYLGRRLPDGGGLRAE
jgi:AraC-like DNA-binding protein